MSRPTSGTWTDITGDASTFEYRPLYGTGDVVYRTSEYAAAAKVAKQRPYKVLRICFKTNSSGVALKQDGTTAVSVDVAAQLDAPWLYDIQEILSGETVANASGPVTQNVREDDLDNLADVKTLIAAQTGAWADPSA